MASFMFPLFMPPGLNVRRARCACWSASPCLRPPIWPRSCAAACRRVPKGQVEAAAALGLALLADAAQDRRCRRRCGWSIPAIVNTFIGTVQGHVARHHRQPLRPDRRAAAGAGLRRQLAPLLHSRATSSSPCIYLVFCFAMSRYSQLGREAPATRDTRAERERCRHDQGTHRPTHHRVHRRQQVVRRLSTCCATSTSSWRGASASSSAGRRARASRR